MKTNTLPKSEELTSIYYSCPETKKLTETYRCLNMSDSKSEFPFLACGSLGPCPTDKDICKLCIHL